MKYLEIFPSRHNSVQYLFAERERIQTHPDYQRNGDVWTRSKKQLLIDSILNNFDLPKLYLHELTVAAENDFEYAIIDGRQRLEATWDFIENKFPLAADFVYQENPDLVLAGKTYDELAEEFPRIRSRFDNTQLPVITVRTINDDLEPIEEMFSRLNEASPLNAAEKRNALGGDFVKVINSISAHEFFAKKVKFNNNRYQHKEVAARILLTEYSMRHNGKLMDTKKIFLDDMAKQKELDPKFIASIESGVEKILSQMSKLFDNKDSVLSAQGLMVVYFLLFKKALSQDELNFISRDKLIDFRMALSDNRSLAEENFEQSNFEYLEFERLNQQGTNDASSIRERTRIMAQFLGLSNPEMLAVL